MPYTLEVRALKPENSGVGALFVFFRVHLGARSYKAVVLGLYACARLMQNAECRIITDKRNVITDKRFGGNL